MHRLRQVALDVAETQGGVVSRSQGRAGGMTDHMVDGCLADGLFILVAPGVYRVRGAPQNERMAVAAAALATGGGISHVTAARQMQLRTPLGVVPLHATVDVGTCHPRTVRLAIETDEHAHFAVKVHRFREMGEPMVTVDGVRCTDPARTLIEIARWLDPDDLEDAFERAAPNPLESKLEGRAWRMLRASSLPAPHRQLRVDVAARRWHRLDFAWPELRVAFETEGFEWHGTRARWKQDRVRTASLEQLGWRIVVADWDDVVIRRHATVNRIAMALAERRLVLRSA